jgi:hypothetical protein
VRVVTQSTTCAPVESPRLKRVLIPCLGDHPLRIRRFGGRKIASRCPEAVRSFVVSLNGANGHRKVDTRSQAIISGRDLPGRKETRQRPAALLNRTGNDLSAFGITLTFVFALVSMAAYSDRPAFWLSAGPTAIAILFFTASLVHVGLLNFSKANRSRSRRAVNRSAKSLVRVGYAKLAAEC